MSFSFDLHSAAVSDSHLSCRAYAAPMPCSDHSVILKATEEYSRLSTAVLWCGLENKCMVGAWHGHGMASVNHTRPHCVNQMGKTHSKPLAARHGMGTAWARHGMRESAFNCQVCLRLEGYLELYPTSPCRQKCKMRNNHGSPLPF